MLIKRGLPAWMITKNSVREIARAWNIGQLSCGRTLILGWLHDLVGVLESFWISVSSLINIMLEAPCTTISLI